MTGPKTEWLLTITPADGWYSLILEKFKGTAQHTLTNVEFEVLDSFAPPGEAGWRRAPGATAAWPNPTAVVRLAAAQRWGLDSLALDTIVGRWVGKALRGEPESVVVAWLGRYRAQLDATPIEQLGR